MKVRGSARGGGCGAASLHRLCREQAMGIVHVHSFPFPEPPARESVDAAQGALRCIGALDASAEARTWPARAAARHTRPARRRALPARRA